MKSIYKKALFLLFAFGTCLSVQAQMNYTNLEWVDRTPIVGNSIFHTSTIVVSGQLYITGNTLNGSGNTDIYTIKLDTNGDTLWSATYGGSASGDDYGVELKQSSDGFIYVIGAAQNTGTGYDYCLLKYNASTGSQAWAKNWNGAGNGDDIPSNLIVDGSSAIYVCGGSQASNGLSDYGIIKVTNLSSVSWSKYYDYNSLHDAATTISFSGFDIVVSGGSVAAVGDWDIATLKMSKINGSISQTTRTNITGATMVEANAMTTDSLNNIYITGYALTGDKDIQTVKLDSNLALVWIVSYEGTYDDIGKDIGVDASGNVYVTGVTELQNGGTNFITIKYSSSGTEQWVRQIGNAGDEEYAEAEKISITSGGDIYLTGTVADLNSSKMMFVKYNTAGEIRIAKDYESDTIDYEAYDINVDGSFVYITGLEKTIDTTRLTILKYEIAERKLVQTTDTTDAPYIENAIIVSFFSDVVNTSIVDNKNITTGMLDEFVDSATIAQMSAETGTNCGKLRTFKIFREMTTADSLSITRLGDTIKIDPLWSTLLVYIDEADDEAEFIDSISTITGAIKYAEKDYIAEQFSVPNDSYYSQYQKGLYPNVTYPDADINVEAAWDIEVGQPTTTVAVIDALVFWSHEEFGNGTLTGSKIIDGFDFYNGNPLSVSSSSESHGTACAGIIGAFRNNSQGVAGIAGGDVALSNTGVEFYTLGIFDGEVGPSTSTIAEAIVVASFENPMTGYGYGSHLQNNSYGTYEAAPNLLNDAVRVAWRNHSIFVAARGNNYGTFNAYPACFEDDRVINVGACGTNGEIKVSGSGDPYSSNYSGEMDLIAPGATELIMTTITLGAPYNYGFTTCQLGSSYQCFTGTSASAPHVTGVAALIYSHHNILNGFSNNLATEDVEYLLENSADDRHTTVGYDVVSGWGLLNAGDALAMIESPYYYILHASDEPDLVQYLGTSTITLSPENEFDIPNGSYFAKQYKVSWSFTVTLPANHDILDTWLLEGATYKGVDNSVSNPDGPWMYTHVTLIADNQVTISGYTYIWHLESNVNTFEVVQEWYPYSPDDVAMTHSLYVQTNEILAVNEKKEEFDLQIYPNPSNMDLIEVALTLENEATVSYQVVNVLGEIILTSPASQLEGGKSKISVPLNGLPAGTYFCHVTVNGEIHSEKFIVM